VEAPLEPTVEPILEIKQVAGNSPASKAGMLPGDLLLEFGPVISRSSTAAVDYRAEVRSVVAESEGVAVRVVVHRKKLAGDDDAGARIELILTPATWAGEGLLGCRFGPVSRKVVVKRLSMSDAPSPLRVATASPAVQELSSPTEEDSATAVVAPVMQKDTSHTRRKRIVDEVMQTEDSYIGQLSTAVDDYMFPLRAQIERKPDVFALEGETLTIRGVDLMFSNIEMVLEFNKTLHGRLKDVVPDFAEETKIGDIFVDLAPFLKVYTNYSNGYDAAERMFRKWNDCAEFRSFLGSRRSAEGSLDLNSLLIAPVQRVPRYVLLLRDLLEHTANEHVDYESLSRALELVKATGAHINASMRRAQAYSALRELQAEFVDNIDLVDSPQREFLQRLSLTDAENRKSVVMLLLSDMVLLARSKKGKSLKLLARIDIGTALFGETDHVLHFTLRAASGETHTLQADSQKAREHCLAALESARDSQLVQEGERMQASLTKRHGTTTQTELERIQQEGAKLKHAQESKSAQRERLAHQQTAIQAAEAKLHAVQAKMAEERAAQEAKLREQWVSENTDGIRQAWALNNRVRRTEQVFVEATRPLQSPEAWGDAPWLLGLEPGTVIQLQLAPEEHSPLPPGVLFGEANGRSGAVRIDTVTEAPSKRASKKYAAQESRSRGSSPDMRTRRRARFLTFRKSHSRAASMDSVEIGELLEQPTSPR
jgi:RhoGEF domain